MATYTMTPQERRARALALREQRQNRILYRNALRENATKTVSRQPVQAETPVKESEEQNFLIRGVATVGDFVGNILTGAVKGLEGIYDLGAGLVGAVGGIFSEDFQKGVQDHIAYDFTGQHIGNPLQELTKDSYLNEGKVGGFIENVASGVGQMLPAVAVSLIPGVGQAASLVTMGVSAAGSNTEEAFNDGAEYYRGLGYGLASGVVEAATEKLTGGSTKGIFGKGIVNFGKEVAEQGAKRVAKEAIEEGAEELISHAVNPVTKMLYKGTDALKEYGSADYYKEGLNAFLVGAGTGIVYSGTVGHAVGRAKGLNPDIDAAVEANERIENKLTRAQDNNRLNDAMEKAAAQSKAQNLKNIEAALKKASPNNRKKYIENYRLSEQFNEDGSLKAEISPQTSESNMAAEASAVSENGASNTAEALDKRYYSVNMRGSEQQIRDTLAQLSLESGEDVKLFSGELTEKGQANFTKMKKTLTSMNKRRGESVNFVIVESNKTFHGVKKDNNVIYIAADTLERDASMSYLDEASRSGNYGGTLFHEYDHTNEGTAEHNNLYEFLAKDDALFEEAKSRVFNDYGISQETAENISQKMREGAEVTTEEREKLRLFVGETGATMAERVLGNERTINRLVLENEPLVERILGQLKTFKERLAGKGDNYSRAERRRIDKALDLYLKAAEAAGKRDLALRIMAMRDEDEESVDGQDGSDNAEDAGGNRTVHYSAKNARNAEGDSIKKQLRENLMELNQMQPVADIRYNVSDKKQAREDAKKLYKSIGFKVDRPNFGIIELGEKEIGESSNYLNTEAEFAAWMAIPKVLKRGKLISSHLDHKNEGFSTYTIAAPVVINGQRGNVAAIVKKTGKRRYKTHRILMPDGSNFVYSDTNENAESTGSDILPVKKKKGPDIDSASNISIPDFSKKVNGNSQFSYKSFLADSGEGTSLMSMNDGNVQVSGVRPSQSNAAYSYETLIQKGDIAVTELPTAIPVNQDGSMDKKAVISQGRLNARKQNNPHNTNTETYVRIDDIGLDVLLGAKGLQHGLARSRETALAIMKIGDILKGSVTVNELNGDVNRKVDMSYVLLGACKDNENLYAVRSVVSKLTNDVTEIDVYQLGAVKGKKTEIPNSALKRGAAVTEQNSLISSGSPMISISDFLQHVKGIPMINEVFSADVAKELGVARSIGSLSKDLRFSRKPSSDTVTIEDPTDKPYFRKLTLGQQKKMIANATKKKVYSKAEAEAIIDGACGDILSSEEGYGKLVGKSKKEAVDILWQELNSAVPGKKGAAALKVAKFIVHNIVLKRTVDNRQIAEIDFHEERLAILRSYLHELDLGGLSEEIRKRYDKDRSVYLRWGVRKGEHGLHVDSIVEELREQGIYIEATHPADILFKIDTMYSESVNALKKEADVYLEVALSKKECHEIEQQIAGDILRGFDEKGKPSDFSKLMAKYDQKILREKEKAKEEKKKTRTIHKILYLARLLRDQKYGVYLNASYYKKETETFKSTIGKLANISYRGNLVNSKSTRRIFSNLLAWYENESNPFLREEGGPNFELYSETVAKDLESLATGEGEFTYEELLNIVEVLEYFKHFVENFKKVWRYGKQVEIEPQANEFVGITQENKGVKEGTLRKILEGYLEIFGDPMTVMRYMDRYQNGFHTQMYEEIRKGAAESAIVEMEIRVPLETFYSENKRFKNDLYDKTVNLFGQQLPLGYAISLYMTLNRVHAHKPLARKGFKFFEKTGSKRKTVKREATEVNGFAVGMELTTEELQARAKAVQKNLAKQFTETEMQYISIVEKIFNSDCKELKKATDVRLRGISNVLDGFYFPMRTAEVADNVEYIYRDEMQTISNASFNKHTKDNENMLLIESIDVVLDRHIRGVCQYATLAPAIDAYNRIRNFQVETASGKTVSVKSESEGVWRNNNRYMQNVLQGLQGKYRDDLINNMTRELRRGHAIFQLGANLKVLLTQFSSLIAATNLLDVGCIRKGLFIDRSEVDNYCALAKVRNTENVRAQATTLLEKTNKLGDWLMKPIGVVDRIVVKWLFGACQLQVEKNGGPKVGTTENKTKAGELLEKLILETQQNTLATEKSSAARSENEIAKGFVMFYGDQMKLTGRVIDGVGETVILKKRRKLATDPAEIAAFDEKIKKATQKARRAIGALVATAIFQALLAQLFRWLYAKDDEDENVVQNVAIDTVGNLLGGLPLIRDIVSFFADGYELEEYSYSMINDALHSAKNVFTMAENWMEGDFDSRELAANTRKLLYSCGQITGIPFRNFYNMGHGIIKRLSPSAAYSIDDMFYKQSYRSDLAKAVEKGDDKMIATIAGLMLNENVGGISDKGAREALDALVQKGYDVIPRSVNSTVTFDGEEYEMTASEEKHFEKIYSVANEALADLVKLSQYAEASDEVQAKAVNFIYDVYYKLALQDYLGIELETKSVLFAEAIDIEKLALIVSTAKTFTADTDKTGKAITGSKKRKIQAYVSSLRMTAAEKYMIMGYLGYTNTNGEAQVKAYINRLKLTKAEKAKLLAYSGYSN